MTTSENDDNPVIDGLVRSYLERNAANLDSSALVQRILADRSPGEAVAPVSHHTSIERKRDSRRRWSFPVSWWGISTLAIVVAFLYGRHFDNLAANASIVLRDVQSEHARSVDHCYRVRFDPDPRYWDPDNKLGGPSLSHLWTRGDRFWSDCAIGDVKFKVGRDASGTVWISPSREKGIRFSNQFENLPRTVQQICQINSMNVPRLMNEVLVDFDLKSESMSDPSGAKRTLVWAQLKPGRTHSLLSHVLLEIDPQTNILVRLVLWTVEDGKPKGTVAFTLLESATLEDEQYELDSHLNPDAEIEVHAFSVPDYDPNLSESPIAH